MKNQFMKLITQLAQKMSNKYPLNLLMLVEREGYSNFRLFISSDTLTSDLTTLSIVTQEISKMLTHDEFNTFSGVEIVDARSDFFIEIKDYLENNGNPNELYNLEFGGLKINRALVIISPVDHSKKYVRVAELEQMLMLLMQFLITQEELQHFSKQKLQNNTILKQDSILKQYSING